MYVNEYFQNSGHSHNNSFVQLESKTTFPQVVHCCTFDNCKKDEKTIEGTTEISGEK